jgi:hypothetical protein
MFSNVFLWHINKSSPPKESHTATHSPQPPGQLTHVVAYLTLDEWRKPVVVVVVIGDALLLCNVASKKMYSIL